MDQREANENTQNPTASSRFSNIIEGDIFKDRGEFGDGDFDWSPFSAGPSVGASNNAPSSPYPQEVTWPADDASESKGFDLELPEVYPSGVLSTSPIPTANEHEDNFVFENGCNAFDGHPDVDFGPSSTNNLELSTPILNPDGSASAEGFHDHVPLIGSSSRDNDVNVNFPPHSDFMAFLAHFDSPTYPAPQFPSSDGTHVNSPERVISTRTEHDADLFPCDEPGCNKSYRSLTNLRRHMKVHSDAKCPCPVNGCRREFHRLDKVRDHLRGGHKLDEGIVVWLLGVWKANYEQWVRTVTHIRPGMQ